MTTRDAIRVCCQRGRAIPARRRVALFVLLASAVVTPAVVSWAALEGLRGQRGAMIAVAQPGAVSFAVSLLLPVCALLVLERPRSRSFRAYLAQLREGLLSTPEPFDGDDRRRTHAAPENDDYDDSRPPSLPRA